MQTMLGIALFGLLGIFSRYGIERVFNQSHLDFPAGTFFINLLGSFLVGVFYVFGNEKEWFSPSLSVAILVGFTGGFTTFSTYCLQSLLLMERQRFSLAFAYLILSPALGLAAALLGVLAARQV